MFIEGEPDPPVIVHAANQERAAKLRARAGVWAVWPKKSAPGTVGALLAKIGPDYEVKSGMHGGVRRTFARWVGQPALPPAPSPEEEPPAANGAQATRPSSPPVAAAPKLGDTRDSTRPARPVRVTPTPGVVRPGGETITVYDDNGDVLDGVSPDAYRPKVKCPACKTYIVIDEHETADSMLREHYKENDKCKQQAPSGRRPTGHR